MPRIDYFHEHFLDRRKCMNCGNYRNWQEMPVCPCGWPRFKNFNFSILKEDKPLAQDKVGEACAIIILEYMRASDIFPPFNSAHEGYAVILEELDELKAEVWKNQNDRDPAKLMKEAVHVAAMALRFIVDLCPFEIKEKEES